MQAPVRRACAATSARPTGRAVRPERELAPSAVRPEAARGGRTARRLRRDRRRPRSASAPKATRTRRTPSSPSRGRAPARRDDARAGARARPGATAQRPVAPARSAGAPRSIVRNHRDGVGDQVVRHGARARRDHHARRQRRQRMDELVRATEPVTDVDHVRREHRLELVEEPPLSSTLGEGRDATERSTTSSSLPAATFEGRTERRVSASRSRSRQPRVEEHYRDRAGTRAGRRP